MNMEISVWKLVRGIFFLGWKIEREVNRDRRFLEEF